MIPKYDRAFPPIDFAASYPTKLIAAEFICRSPERGLVPAFGTSNEITIIVAAAPAAGSRMLEETS